MNLSFNPYEPPGEVSKGLYVIPSRSSLAASLRRFLASEITTFALSEEIEHYLKSDDPIIQHILEALVCYYEDCDNELVCLDRKGWDYFQRLLLVLESDCRVEKKTQERWSIRQLIAAVALCGFVGCILKFGWSEQLLLSAILFGAISIALSFWPSKQLSQLNPYDKVIYPFASFADLAIAYRRSDFHKMRYPTKIGVLPEHSKILSCLQKLAAYGVWSVMSPIVLIFQMMPDIRCEERIVVDRG